MNIRAISNAVTGRAHRSLLIGKKFSPQALTVIGIVGSVTSTVLASRATLKLQPVVEELRVEKELYKEQYDVDAMSTTSYNRELTLIYAKHSVEIVKLYAPAVAVGVASVGCLIGAQGIMQRRNAALTAAYVAVEQGFNEYRRRVQEALGEEKERELRYGVVTDRVDDTKKGVVTEQKFVDPNGASVYARFFDQLNPNWNSRADFNMFFLRAQQNYANDLLRARRHLFLNEVYDQLGIERTPAGNVVGWVLSETGDNYVDFGIFTRGDNERVREFVNGREASILLDFNVDGVILDKI